MLGALQGPLQQGLQSQNQQQQSNNMPQQGGQQQNNIPPPPPQNGQDFTLSSVLHFLQTEWRKYERDRNEWEIERAEMRVRTRSWLFRRALRVVAHDSGFVGPHSSPGGGTTLI